MFLVVSTPQESQEQEPDNAKYEVHGYYEGKHVFSEKFDYDKDMSMKDNMDHWEELIAEFLGLGGYDDIWPEDCINITKI